VAHAQASAFGVQGGIQRLDRAQDEFDAAVGPQAALQQRFENVAVEDKDAMHLRMMPQGMAQGGMVEIAQIAAEPERRALYGIGHGVGGERWRGKKMGRRQITMCATSWTSPIPPISPTIF
jgi:hypothetical protein